MYHGDVALDSATRSQQFGALADETRLRILLLLRDGECCVCELTEALELGQSLLSFHLKALKDAGLVTDRREGRWVYYSSSATGLRQLASSTMELVPNVRRTARRCT
jgi:ArsR family transcriptional regulator, arsenate/arsenite/antimonite-responsive transcriptional repressor